MSLLSVQSLTIRRNKKTILDKINFDLNHGKVIGIVGNNGSGKTSLAYALSGIIPYYYHADIHGDILINGTSILKDKFEHRIKTISCSFQDPDNQFLFGKVEDIFDLSSTLLMNCIKIWELENVLDQEPKNLSGGEKQKITLLACLINNPMLLIFDEATTALDVYSRYIFGKFISFLNQNGLSIILLSQRASSIKEYSDNVFVINNKHINREEYTSYKKYNKNKDSLIKTTEKLLHLNNTSRITSYDFMALIKIRDICTFRKKNEGEVFFLIGKNASGKTTSIINLIRKLDKKIIKISLLLQNPSYQLLQENTLNELFTDPSTPPQKELLALIQEVFPFLDFEKDPFEYSYGEQKIIIILSCFLSDAELIILDEPEQGLDESNLEKIELFINLMREKYGKKIIVISHDIDFLCRVADAYAYLTKNIISYSTNISKEKIEGLFFEK